MITYVLILYMSARSFENPKRVEFSVFESEARCEAVGINWQEQQTFNERRWFECQEK